MRVIICSNELSVTGIGLGMSLFNKILTDCSTAPLASPVNILPHLASFNVNNITLMGIFDVFIYAVYFFFFYPPR